ncbi:MAG TPA: DUF4880 domain-containing protein [Bradyrhizobium sp.]|nr:DUF4880 domain-containing protein [Bradyrhizobium sp.]
MTIPTESIGPDPLLDEAISWVVLLKTGEPTRADAEALQQWRDRSAEHEAAFRRAVRLHRDAGLAAARLTEPSSRVSRSHVMSRRALIGGGLATAAAVGYAMIEPPMGLWPSLQELSADFRTAKGEQRRVQVSSAVSLDLNTQTSIALRTQRGRQVIELLSGEVVVNARGSGTDPVLFLANDGEVSATDTNFAAECLNGMVHVTCLDGAAEVRSAGQSARIRKGQQIAYSRAGIGPAASVDPAQVTAWKSGLLIFRNRPFASVVEEVNRYRPGKIVVVRAELKQRAVNADFEIGKLDSFVEQVEQLFGAKAISLPGGLVILS